MLSLERADGTRRVGIVSLVGLLLIPLVVAGGFLLATWKSSERLDRVQAAVVNLDEPVTLNKQLVPLGRQLAGGLVKGADDGQQNFDWVLTDASDANDGLTSGRYAAVVTIPKTFSANATSYSKNTGDGVEPATLGVATSQVSGIADPVVGQAIAAAATKALNNQLTEAYLKNIYLGFNETGKQFTKVADAAGKLSDGTRSLADGIDKTADGTAEFADGMGQLDTGAQQLATGADGLSTGTQKLATGLDTFADKTAALPGGARQLAKGAQQAADGSDQLASGSAGIAGGLKTYQQALRAQADQIRNPPANPPAGGAVPTCPQTEPALTEAQCGAVLQAIGGAAQQAAAQSLEGAAAGLSTKDPKTGQSLISGASALAGGQKKAAAGLQQLANGVDQLADGLPAISTGLRSSADGAQKLASGVAKYSTGVSDFADGVGASADGARQLSSGVTKLAAGGDQLADGSEKLSDGLASGAKEIPTYDATARDRLSSVVAAPVVTPQVTSAFSNVATTTLLAVLALWIGGLASFLVLRPVSARALASMKPSWRLALESFAPAAVIGTVQAVVLTALLSALLDLGAGETVRLFGLALLAALAFVAVNQALAAWFGGAGRFVSVVLLVLTAAGAMTSALPGLFDTVTPLLPLTPALVGLRAVATGASAGGPAGLLLAWLIIGAVTSVLAVARHRVVAPLVARTPVAQPAP